MSEYILSGFYYPNGEPIMVEELRWFKKRKMIKMKAMVYHVICLMKGDLKQ